MPLPAAAETASGVELGWEPWSGAQSLVAAAQAAAQAAIQPRPPPPPPASLLLEVSSLAITFCFWESRHSMYTANREMKVQPARVRQAPQARVLILLRMHCPSPTLKTRTYSYRSGEEPAMHCSLTQGTHAVANVFR